MKHTSLYVMLIISVLPLICSYISYRNKWFIGKALTIAVFRCLVQLMLLGYLLKIIFTFNRIDFLLLTILCMTLTASYSSYKRIQYKIPNLWFYNFITLLATTWPITIVCLLFMDSSQITNSQYVIPFAGMIIGNALNGISMGVDHFTIEVMENRRMLTTLLAFGASSKEASYLATLKAMKTSTAPIINSMSVAGIVSVPGMMTGQVMAGMSPIEGAKYQFIVMAAIASSIFLGAFLGIRFCKHKLFKNGLSLEFLIENDSNQKS